MSKPAVLIADDDPVHLALLAGIFSKSGTARTLMTMDGLAALQAVDANSSDLTLVVLDIHMPGCDGVEVLMSLKDRRYEGGVFIMSSCEVMVPMAKRLALGLGLNLIGASTKPVDPTLMISTVEYLESRTAQRPSIAGFVRQYRDEQMQEAAT